MPIDTSIITRGMNRVEMEPQSNALARLLQVQGAQQSQEMNALKMDEYRRGLEDQNQLRAALGVPGADPYKVLIQRGKVKEAGDYRSGQLESEKKSFDLNKERFGVVRRAAASFANDPTISRDKVLSALQAYSVGGVVPEHLAASFAKEMPEDPAQLKEMLLNFAKQDLTSEQLFTLFAPKATQIDSGQQISFRDTNPNSPTYGQVTGGAPIQRQQTPESRASVAASLANAGATRDVAQATRDAARIQTGFQSEQGLRKEFEALPEVKNYKKALPAFKGIEDAVTRSTPQSDINIVYGIAKLYDPESVVREGEYATVANSPNIPDRIKGYAQYLAGGGKLTPKVKDEILAEATSRMKSYEDQYTGSRSDFESIAQRSQVDPTRVFPSPVKPAASNRPVDLGSLPSGKGKVVNFGDLK